VIRRSKKNPPFTGRGWDQESEWRRAAKAGAPTLGAEGVDRLTHRPQAKKANPKKRAKKVGAVKAQIGQFYSISIRNGKRARVEVTDIDADGTVHVSDLDAQNAGFVRAADWASASPRTLPAKGKSAKRRNPTDSELIARSRKSGGVRHVDTDERGHVLYFGGEEFVIGDLPGDKAWRRIEELSAPGEEGEVERRMYRLRLGGKANPKPQKIRKRRSNPEDHAQSPFHGTLLRAGWAYSHTTPVVMGGDRRASYSYKRGEHNVGVLHAPWGWEWSGGHAGTQTGRSGRTAEALAKYLRGVASREKKHAEQQASRRAERAEKDARMRKFDALLKRNPKRRRS